MVDVAARGGFVSSRSAPGAIWTSEVLASLADGTELAFRRRIITWSADPIEAAGMQRDAVVAQWATGADDVGGRTDQPISDAMLIEVAADGSWEYGSISGRLCEQVSAYVPADPWTNSIAVMAAAAREQAETAGRSRERWTAAQCAAYIGVTESTWRAYVAAGRAPQPRRDGRVNLWIADEVRAWHRSRPRVGTR